MAGHDLEGLMNWLERDEWRPAFEGLMEVHLGQACERIDGSAEDLSKLLDEQTVAVLWGCVFEDFLTWDIDGRNVVNDYLKRRGFRETTSTRAYMNGLRKSVMSLYEVSELRPGVSFLARDLIRGGEPVLVHEKSGSRQLKPWDRVAARLVTVGPKTLIAGGILPFDHEGANAFLEIVRERERALGPNEGALVGLAPLFTTAWLAARLDGILNPNLPVLRNTDGDPILFTTIRYPLLKGAKAAAVRAALDRGPGFHRETTAFWNWLGDAPPASPAKTGDRGLTIGSWTPDGSTVLGTIELKRGRVILEVNSKERAATGQGLLADLLDGLAGEPQITARTLEELQAGASSDQPAEDTPALPPEFQQALQKEWLDKYYRALLDQPVPMLGNRTPRELARSMEIDPLAAWLKVMENGAARTASQGEIYDLAWMWHELGIATLRR
jgi:hypothetical protein